MAETPSIVRAASRTIPSFFILDESARIVGQSDEGDVSRYVRHVRDLPAWGLLAVGESRLDVFDHETILRLVAVDGAGGRFIAVFVEHVRPRGSLAATIDRYRLTRRECEVFDLLARSLSNGEIARRLSITENTVGDHVKNLLKKTRTKKRFELIALMYGLDELAPPDPERDALDAPLQPSLC